MALLSARIIAATWTLATLPLADIHLWTDGSVSVNGDGEAGFAIFVWGTLRVIEAGPAGHGISEAMACFAGLQAGLTLQDY